VSNTQRVPARPAAAGTPATGQSHHPESTRSPVPALSSGLGAGTVPAAQPQVRWGAILPFRAWPVLAIGLLLLVSWYGLSLHGNWPQGQQAAPAHAGFWQIAGQAMQLDNPWVPPPHQVVHSLWNGLFGPQDAPDAVRIHLGTTAEEAGLGLLCGSMLGLLIATLFVHVRVLELGFLPYVVASQTVPVLALAPILISLVGMGLAAKVLVATYLVFFAVTVSAVKGFKSADALAHELLRSYAANPWQIYWKLRFPAALPYIFTGLKIGSTAALVGAIVAELVGSEYGLGALLVAGTNFNRYLLLWSAMLAASLLGLAAYLAIAALERLVVRVPRVSL